MNSTFTTSSTTPTQASCCHKSASNESANGHHKSPEQKSPEQKSPEQKPAEAKPAQSQPTVHKSAQYKPRFDLWEQDDKLVLYGDLPGVGPDDLEILHENRQLTIHGKVSPQRSGQSVTWREYGVGDFHRTFAIGESIDADAITAELRDGVLTVQLPKVVQAKSRRIQVNAN